MRYPITCRQKQALEAIARLNAKGDEVGCSYRELAAELGIGTTAAIHLVKRLIERGHLKRLRPHAARSLVIIKAGAPAS